MKKSKIVKLLIAGGVLFPVVSSAAFSNIQTLITDFKGLINTAIPLVVGLALLYFLWGVGQFILKAGNDQARNEGKQRMIWGIVALFVIFSIWGIIWWVGDLFGIPTGITPGTNTPPSSTFQCPPGTIIQNNVCV